jgi:hypothetical protein
VTTQSRPGLRLRLVVSISLALGVVFGGAGLTPTFGGAGDGEKKALLRAYDEATADRRDAATAHPHTGPVAVLAGTTAEQGHVHGVADGHGHSHNDPATKNALARGGELEVADPTTPAQARRNAAAVAQQRREPDPKLVRVPKPSQRLTSPQNRYVMAGGCYALRGPAGWVVKDGSAYAANGKRRAAEPFHFKATTLGKYLLWDSAERFLSTDANPLGPGVAAKAAPSESSIWTVRKPGGFRFVQAGEKLRAGDPVTTAGKGSTFRLRLTKGCARWPDIGTQISGRPFAGTSDFQEVRGTADTHTHGMAFRFLGGAHCGKPWSPYGVTDALQDCEDHQATNGCGTLETALSGEPCHDPVGWPTFVDWPAPDSLTHEGTYHRWMERSWRGGLRLFTNLLVENNQLCQLYPFKDVDTFSKTRCDDMRSVELQAEEMRELERYVDAQYGGPGKGWYRIVTSPWEARRVINQGKLAVVMGIETSIPFGCTVKLTVPQCDKKQIDNALARAHKMGVRQMELVNKFDNALAGVAGDAGETGVLVNSANFAETQSFWRMESCDPEIEGAHDKPQIAAPEISPDQQDALFGAIAKFAGTLVQPVPAYGPPQHCNQTGLSDLGKHLIKRMAQRSMIFDPDHMSVKARAASLDLLERLEYPGVLSSHSWATPDAYPRIYKLGGFITPYAGDSTGFVDKWRQHLKWADKRFYFGFGYGADTNGLGAQGDPRPDAAANPVTYPFTGYGGVTVRKQRSGERVYDVNADGVAHYGLYPDWFKDLEKIAGKNISTDMMRGAEAYLQMWERAEGVTNDACRQPAVAKRAGMIRGLRSGLTVKQVLLRAGQPHERLGQRFTYCGKKPSGKLTEVTLRFRPNGRLR